ncbi:MAG: glycosyltransferase [Telluria sp.]|nr:glycosyltransferase [Telluria sp.]
MSSILLTARSLDVINGGPSQNIPMLAASLIGKGLRVGVLSGVSGEFHPRLASFGVPTFIGPPARTRGYASFLANVLDSFEPELVHDNGLWLRENHIVAGMCAKRRLPFIVSPRGMLEPWALQTGRFKKRLAWALYQRRDLQRAACIVATSDEERTSVLSLLPAASVAVVPNGWSPPLTAPATKREAGYDRRVLFFSRIHPKKGVEILLEAWTQLRPREWRLDIVGPGEASYVDALRRGHMSPDNQTNVRFMPPVYGEDEKISAISSADVVVLPSFSENFGSIIVEALGLGVPVVTTTGTPWRELPARQAGWWVEPSAAAIAAALREAMALTDEQRADMGRRGRDWILSDFAWDSVASRMIHVYEQVLAGARDE